MSRLTAKEVIDAYQPLSGAPASLRASRQILRELARGKPLSVARAAEVSGQDLEAIQQSFDQAKKMGAEFNEQGELVGNTLSLNPTPYHFQVNGNAIFTWCALDTMIIPGVIDATALVESKCYITGCPIQLTVTPDGVTESSPETTVLSIFVPGLSPTGTADGLPVAGPQSEVCRQMRFFQSRQVAEEALKNFPNVGILSVEESYQLARKAFIDPFKELP